MSKNFRSIVVWAVLLTAAAPAPASKAQTGGRRTEQVRHDPTTQDLHWSPSTVPGACSGADVHLLMGDVSGSMVERGLLEPALQQLAQYVLEAPACTYVVYAEFGTSARIVADAFLTSDSVRERLAASIRSVPEIQQWTNFDEAAELVELTLLKTERAYGNTPWSFTVSVISDHDPDPSEGHAPFDLAQYLKERRLTAGVGVLRVELVPAGTDFAGVQRSNSDGRVIVEVTGLAPFLQSVPHDAVGTVSADSKSATAPVSPPKFLEMSDEEAEGNGGTPLGLSARAVWGCSLAVVLLAGLLWLARARSNAKREADRFLESARGLHDTTEGQIPAALQITEWQVSEDGERTLLQGPRMVPYSARAPVTLGSDMSRVVVGLRTPGISGRLARIHLDGRGAGKIEPLNGTFDFDEEPLTRARDFSAESPHMISVQCPEATAEVHFEPASGAAEREDALRRRISKRSRESTNTRGQTNTNGGPGHENQSDPEPRTQ